MSAAPEERYEVGDLDPAGVLAEAERVEVESRRIEIRRLELAYQWAVLHPATAETGVETPGGPALGVLDAEETLGGDGTPAVAAFAPESLAAAMGWTPTAARNLIADALDLIHRHPEAVEAGPPRPGPGLAGPPGRPADPPTAPGGCPVGRRPARRPDRLRPRDHRPARRPSRRHLRPRRTRPPRRPGARLIRCRAVPPSARRVRRSQRPHRPRRHPDPASLLRPGLRHRPPAPPRRRHHAPG